MNENRSYKSERVIALGPLRNIHQSTGRVKSEAIEVSSLSGVIVCVWSSKDPNGLIMENSKQMWYAWTGNRVVSIVSIYNLVLRRRKDRVNFTFSPRQFCNSMKSSRFTIWSNSPIVDTYFPISFESIEGLYTGETLLKRIIRCSWDLIPGAKVLRLIKVCFNRSGRALAPFESACLADAH